MKVLKTAIKAGTALIYVSGKALSVGTQAIKHGMDALEKGEALLKKSETALQKTEPVVQVVAPAAKKVAPAITKTTLIITAAAALITGIAIGILVSPLKNGILLNFGLLNSADGQEPGAAAKKHCRRKKGCCAEAKENADEEEKFRLPKKSELFSNLRGKKSDPADEMTEEASAE